MEYCKLQVGCLLLVLYIAFIYIRERKAYGCRKPNRLFEWMLMVGIFGICVDGVTAYTVNHLEEIPAGLNAFFHLCFLSSLDVFVYLVFLYMLYITNGIPWRRNTRLFLMLPLLLNLLVVIAFLPELEYRQGKVTNYSMGISAYTCFVMVAVYILGVGALVLNKWRHLERHKQIIFSTYLVGIVGVTVYQMLQPEALVTSLVVVFTIIGAYLNMENPLFLKLNQYNKEMVMSFATIVENRDGSTGGHIRRTTAYVRLLAEELLHRGFYREQLTQDYINSLVMAAPMHDIGKIAIPDAVLQKPGKLTAEEYETMKTHAARGGQIIRETLGHLGDSSHAEVSYEVATHHHEKWNGSGYPDGLEGNQIPLCARIMAVADVFDAVSANRCYRAALPLERCFRIITEGSGRVCKNAQGRRVVSKNKKANHKQKEEQLKDEKPRFGTAGQRKPIYGEKSEQDAENKGSNVKCWIVPAEYSGVGVEENRNQKCSEQCSEKQCGGKAGNFCFPSFSQKGRKKKHRKKEQLHMFPGGLTDREEKAKQDTVA